MVLGRLKQLGVWDLADTDWSEVFSLCGHSIDVHGARDCIHCLGYRVIVLISIERVVVVTSQSISFGWMFPSIYISF